MAAAGGEQLPDEAGEGLGQDDRLASEAQPHSLVVGVDVAEGEAADDRGPLGVEEDEEPGDAVSGIEAVVVEQLSCLVPAGLGVDDAGRAAPPGGGKVQAGQLLLLRPADEVPGLAGAGGVIAGDPGVQVVLPAGGQGEVAGGEPVQQAGRGRDVPADADQLVVGGAGVPGPPAQAAQQVPDGVVVQHVLLAGVAAAVDRCGDPAFQPGHLLIAVGQRPDGDQDAAQVLDRLAARQRVEGGVSEPGPGVQALQDRRRRALVQPGRDRAGPLGGRERLVKGTKARADFAGLVTEQFTQPAAGGAPGAPAGVDPAGFAAGRAAGPEAGIGTGAGRAERLGPGAAPDAAGPAASRAVCPALLAGPAPWLAGGLRGHARGLFAADTAGRDLPGAAAGAERAAGRADADRPPATAAGAGLLVGRVDDQAVRTQRPAVLVADRCLADGPAAGARLGPGPGHAVAAEPDPVAGLDEGDTRPQCGQSGRTMPLAPAWASRSISRSTDGTGAAAPSPVCSSGRSCKAQAS